MTRRISHLRIKTCIAIASPRNTLFTSYSHALDAGYNVDYDIIGRGCQPEGGISKAAGGVEAGYNGDRGRGKDQDPNFASGCFPTARSVLEMMADLERMMGDGMEAAEDYFTRAQHTTGNKFNALVLGRT